MKIELYGKDLCISSETDFEESMLKDFGRDVTLIPTFDGMEKTNVCGYIIRRKKKPGKYCTCPYDPYDDTINIGVNPDCPIHGANRK